MYEYEEYEIRKTKGGWVFLILATIALLGCLYPWLKLNAAIKELDKNVLAAIKANALQFVLFCGLAVVWFIFTIVSNVRFSRRRRIFGFNFGSMLGRFFLLGEYAAFVILIVVWFI